MEINYKEISSYVLLGWLCLLTVVLCLSAQLNYARPPMGCFKISKQSRSYSWQDGRRQRVLANPSMPNNSLLASPSAGEPSLATEPTVGRFRSPLKLPAKWLDNARRAFSSRYGDMGNGSSSTGLKSANKWKSITDDAEEAADDETDRDVAAQQIVNDLKAKLRTKEEQVDQLEAEVDELNRKLERKQEEVIKLNREVHKLKSVLQVTHETKDGQPDILATVYDHATTVGGQGSSVTKKQGVSGESANSRSHVMGSCQVQQHDKDFRSKQLIKDAIMDNDFLKNLVSFQVREIVDSMYVREFRKGSFVIREGEPGCHLFVSAEGELEVLKDGQNLGKMGPGKAFGELAILYNCTRTASVRVVSNAQIWVLDRRVFQTIMMRTGLQRQEENISFLRSVPLLQNLSNEILAKMADVLEVDFYPAGEYIVRQGATGDTFFIISTGKVKVTQNIPGTNLEEEIRILQRGEYFGEQALLREDRRTANVIALEPGVECLALDRDSFNQLIGELQELQDKHYNDDVRLHRSITPTEETTEYDNIALDDLDVITTLGIGGFGRVELVQYVYDKNKTFALKCLQKQYVLDTQQQEHVFSEKNIMMKCRCDFICRMYKTFTDRKYIYMLMEACLGGEVWSLLRDRGSFDDTTTRFYTACVIEALEYLHGINIIYRDLKPENLLLDNEGYVKLVDFGFSKIIKNGQKTWTFCGTPEYVAPEIILNKGHDRAVDYWSIGVMMYELFTGSPPFMASDPLKTYNIILKGIDFIDFPRNISRTAQSLMKRLCRETPTERLGYQKAGICDIKKHKWFQGFDWNGLRARRLNPPIKPKVFGPTDTSNFDIFPRNFEVPSDETSGWDKDF